MTNDLSKWTTADIPHRQHGLALITGSTKGIGFQDALALSGAGWKVILMGRHLQKGVDAMSKIRQINPDASLEFEQIDLADLSSIRTVTTKWRDSGDAIILLINNA